VGRPKLIICNPKLIICRPKFIIIVQNYFKSNPKLIYYKKSNPTDPGEVFVNGISYKVNKNNKIKNLRVIFTTRK
jgi:hypothetical protein